MPETRTTVLDSQKNEVSVVTGPTAKSMSAATTTDTEQGPRRSSREKRTSEIPMIQKIYFVDTCCCGCPWFEAVGWVAAIEFAYGLVCALAWIVVYVQGDNSRNKIIKGSSQNFEYDHEWATYVDNFEMYLFAAIGLHCAEFIVSMILMIASSKRNRPLCFIWIGCAIVISLGEIATMAFARKHIFTTIIIIPFRIYFIYIVVIFAIECKKFPDGPPVKRVLEPAILPPPTYVAASPVYSPAYPMVTPYPVYPSYYGHYGYHHPYYYGNDIALGYALGAGIGHHHHYYDDGGWGGGHYHDGGGYYDGGGGGSFDGGGSYDSDF